MSREDYERIEAALNRVLEAGADQRDSLIQAICAGDAAFEARLRNLVSLDENHAEQGLLGDASIDQSRRELDELLEAGAGRADPASEFIGPFRIIREIGRGGMGVVYECQQERPSRRVAVKIVESLLFGRELSKRLTAESQIQGQLQHPGIARVYDAGVATFGRSRRPYFVMELIDGEPLCFYADAQKLDTRERLSLIALVADGMMHAHERGVVHRDLKPDNILVEPDGQPKILDFGIARFVGDSTLAATTMTGEGQILGTLAYMAPEQLSGSPDLITPRTDVYAIGAIAYELVTGHKPMEVEGMSVSAAIRAVEFEEPVPVRIHRQGIERDAETIISRCLCRDPAQRFANAGELADDIRRFLADRPIVSRRPTIGYRTRKFVSRNRLLVAGVGATMLALLAGLVASAYFAAGQHTARIAAEQEQQRAQAKELEAIRGVLSGARVLAEDGRAWEAAEQLHTVAPESRGWEWRHIELAAPWTIEATRPSRSDSADRTTSSMLGFLDEFTLIEHDPWTHRLYLVDLFTAERTALASTPIGIRKPQPVTGGNISSLVVQLRDLQIGRLDLANGSFTPMIDADLLDSQTLRGVSEDGSIIVVYQNQHLAIFEESRRVFEMDSGLGDPGGMNWNAPRFCPFGRTVYLTRWGNPGVIIAVDTATWTIRHTRETGAYGPEIVVSADGETIYCTSLDAGIQKYRASDLEPIGAIDAEDGHTQTLSISDDGLWLATGFNRNAELRVFDTRTELVAYSHGIGASHLERALKFSPSGRLAAAPSPGRSWTWLIDLDSEDTGNVTLLRGHSSWVYQLAISADGTLLASAEPETGDVYLWDLADARVIARFARESNPALLTAKMNAPLLFGRDGRSLVFGEVHALTSRAGLTTVDLFTGERSWAETGSYERTLDAVADAIGYGQIFHHAAALPDGRIVQGNASPAVATKIVVRDRIGSPTRATKTLESGALIPGGIAVHPDGSRYASGEYLMVRVRDSETDEVIAEIPDGSNSIVYGMAYSPDGTRFAMGTEDGRVLIFDTTAYSRVAVLDAPRVTPAPDRNYVFNLQWTPDSKRLVTCGGTSIRIFESERPAGRASSRRVWTGELEKARALVRQPGYVRASSPSAAELVATIELWALSLGTVD